MSSSLAANNSLLQQNDEKMKVKFYEHGAHFKFKDLHKSLLGLMMTLPTNRLGNHGKYFNNDDKPLYLPTSPNTTLVPSLFVKEKSFNKTLKAAFINPGLKKNLVSLKKKKLSKKINKTLLNSSDKRAATLFEDLKPKSPTSNCTISTNLLTSYNKTKSTDKYQVTLPNIRPTKNRLTMKPPGYSPRTGTTFTRYMKLTKMNPVNVKLAKMIYLNSNGSDMKSEVRSLRKDNLV